MSKNNSDYLTSIFQVATYVAKIILTDNMDLKNEDETA